MTKNKRRRKTSSVSSIQEYRTEHSALALDSSWLRHQQLLLALALFLMVVGARWWTINKFGSDLPVWDQWDGEGNVIKRYYDGTLTISDWFAPFAEHRIFFTRIFSFGLLQANGQWDGRLQMIVNAIIYALVPCGLFLIFSRGNGIRITTFLVVALALVFTLPYGWSNTIFGFQSQMYFLIAFSLVAIFTLPNSPVGSWSWFVGIIFGGAALLTMGSGLLAAITVLGILTLSTIREWPKWGELYPNVWRTAIVCALIVIIGFFLSERSEIHLEYRAQSLGEFTVSLLSLLAWPGLFALDLFGYFPWHEDIPSLILTLIAWLPFTFFVAAYLSRKIKNGPRERLILGLGLWVLLQAAAMSFFRSKSNIQSRYQDILSFGIIANSLSAIWLINWQTRKGKVMLFLIMLWMVFNSLGIISQTERFLSHELVQKKQLNSSERIRTAGFIVNDDTIYLTAPTNPWEIPYPDPQRLAEMLRDPAFRHVLPVGVQKSLPLVPVEGSPQPSFFEKLSQPLINSAGQFKWDQVGIFSRFAVINPTNRFEYNIIKKNGLSFLYLYFYGNKNNLLVSDSHGEMHKIILLPSDDDEMWHRAFVYCPTMQCAIRGFADTSMIILMEPKEIGPLSICAMAAAQWGCYIFSTGIILFIVVLLISLIRKNSERIVQ